MKSHNIPLKSANEILTQAQHDVDVTKDYDLTIKVRGGVIHTYAKNSSQKLTQCVECERYEEFLRVAEEKRAAEDS